MSRSRHDIHDDDDARALTHGVSSECVWNECNFRAVVNTQEQKINQWSLVYTAQLGEQRTCEIGWGA